MKKIGLLFVTILMMMLFAVSASALEPTGQCGDNVYWSYNETTGELIISGEGDMFKHKYSSSPFDESNIKSVVIEYGVTSIGNSAFYSCTNLTSVTIPDSVTTIGDDAFYNCDSLTSVTIPDSVTTIGNNAFEDCTSLTSVTIPDGVTTIGNRAFEWCTNLTSLTIGKGVTFIGESAFAGCISLTGVYITDLAAWCNIDFADYRSNPFQAQLDGLGGVNLYLNNNLVKDLVIPEGVTKISDYAFAGCGITSITIPASLTTIGKWAFLLCKSLTYITVDENNQYFSNDEFGVLFNKDKTELLLCPIGLDLDNVTEEYLDIYWLEIVAEHIIEYTIPDTVKVIGDTAFYYCMLKDLKIPYGVTTISELALGPGEGLMLYLYIPGSVTYIDDKVDLYLKSVEIGEGITNINVSTNMSFLRYAQNIMIPKTVTEISTDLFTDSYIEEIFYSGTEEQWNNIELSDADKKYLENVKIHFNVNCDSHKYSSETVVTPKCEEVGELKHTCEDCGWYYYEVCFDFDNHDLSEWSVDTPATCTTSGVESRHCTQRDCDFAETREIPAAHSYNKVVTAPTCKEKGYTTYTCKECDHSYVGDYVGGKTHNYTSTLTRPATHLSEGIRTYTCGTCGDSYTEAIAKTKEHSYNTVSKTVAPTCEKEGYTVYICECGQSENRDKKAAKGHNYNGFTCADCGETKADNCSCKCHKKGIANFFWKIGNFFNKLFKIKSKQFCACGVDHY